MVTASEDLARRHYAEHVEKDFFPELLGFITSGPVVAMRWSGESAITVARTLMGPDEPGERTSGDHPRGPRQRHHREHRSRVGLGRVRRPRAAHLVPVTPLLVLSPDRS